MTHVRLSRGGTAHGLLPSLLQNRRRQVLVLPSGFLCCLLLHPFLLLDATASLLLVCLTRTITIVSTTTSTSTSTTSLLTLSVTWFCFIFMACCSNKASCSQWTYRTTWVPRLEVSALSAPGRDLPSFSDARLSLRCLCLAWHSASGAMDCRDQAVPRSAASYGGRRMARQRHLRRPASYGSLRPPRHLLLAVDAGAGVALL